MSFVTFVFQLFKPQMDINERKYDNPVHLNLPINRKNLRNLLAYKAFAAYVRKE